MMEKRFSCKLDHIFWWLIWLLPLLGALICMFLSGDNSFSEFSSFISSFSFSFISDLLGDIETLINIQFPSLLISYASYLVSVEMIHVFVDVLVFIPRLCHQIVEPDNYIIGGKK